MADWFDPIAAFAKSKGYRFMGDIAYCEIHAPFAGTEIEVWISAMGSGAARLTLTGMLAEGRRTHCRAKAKLVAPFKGVVRPKNIIDRIFGRGTPSGDAVFDKRYVALGAADEVRGYLKPAVIAAFVAMWERTEALEVEDGDVVLGGGEFSLSIQEIEFIIDAVGVIATGGVARS